MYFVHYYVNIRTLRSRTYVFLEFSYDVTSVLKDRHKKIIYSFNIRILHVFLREMCF